MIRDRIDADIDRLCVVLGLLDQALPAPAVEEPRAWLMEHDAEISWVFDQAPVTVVPTKNVVGHVQVWSRASTADELVIGKLFVKPSTHDQGIGRYLLTESKKYVHDQGKTPVADVQSSSFPAEFFERYGVAMAEEGSS